MDALSQLVYDACRDPWGRDSNPWVTAASPTR